MNPERIVRRLLRIDGVHNYTLESLSHAVVCCRRLNRRFHSRVLSRNVFNSVKSTKRMRVPAKTSPAESPSILTEIRMSPIEQIEILFRDHGDSQYGFEAVSQQEHALQAAMLAKSEQASPALIAAGLLHDIGHLLHDLPDDATERGIDDRHEELGQRWLTGHFGRDVTEPVRLHVDAKRFLCAVETDYEAGLSEPSRQSMALQGGVMNADEADRFKALQFGADAARLRRWDDAAKVVGLATPPLSHFLRIVADCLKEPGVPQ